MCAYLVDTCVVKKRQQCGTVGTGTSFIIDHSHINAFGVSTNTQAHQTDLNYRQQELETEGPEHKSELGIKTCSVNAAFLKLSIQSHYQ